METTQTFTLERIKEIFPNFNEMPITEFDFWRAAKRAGIIVRTMPLLVDGYYQRRDGKDYILVSSYLKSAKWLHTALHEFSHFLFDVPGPEGRPLYRRRCGDPADPRERWADAFALIGMMPFPELVELQKEEIMENSGLGELVRDRITVFTDFGL